MNLRGLPSVEQLLQNRSTSELVARFGRPLTLQALRSLLEGFRSSASTKAESPFPTPEKIIAHAASLLEEWTAPSLMPVINASGVILHTNLGRALLSRSALQAMESVARGYSNLELDLASGRRSTRQVHAEQLLRHLTGVEAAMVVNNNAAALLLLLKALAARKRVILARSQLVEIGGGFRLPDVMKQSGAKLVEVGTTNKVRLSDYEQALEEPTALVLHVHRSNFKILGFTEEPELKDITSLAHSHHVPCVDDLGSGALLDTARFGLSHEPTVQESLEAGMDLVCISGDKLLGGPQAGIILGQAEMVARLSAHPLARAIRADKLCLAALAATLLHYLKDEAVQEIPVWRMMALAPEQLREACEKWKMALGQGEVLAGKSTVGGGSMPGEELPTFLLALAVKSAEKFLKMLRDQRPPIIARIENNRILLDPRTVQPEFETALLDGIRIALGISD